MPKKCFFH